MPNTSADTVLLLFAHTAEQEVKSKSFAAEQDMPVHRKVAQTFLSHTLSVARNTRLPVLKVFTARQKGSTFGERLANAFHDAFEAGYQRVICIGSDCPSLTESDLLQAHASLQAYNMVIGPAADGGAYLIGMHIDCFNPEAFAMLNWQTGEVLDELAMYSYRQQACLGCVGMLEVKTDVDSAEDLVRVLAEPALSNRIRHVLLGILSAGEAMKRPLRDLLLHPLTQHLKHLLLRAPPL